MGKYVDLLSPHFLLRPARLGEIHEEALDGAAVVRVIHLILDPHVAQVLSYHLYASDNGVPPLAFTANLDKALHLENTAQLCGVYSRAWLRALFLILGRWHFWSCWCRCWSLGCRCCYRSSCRGMHTISQR